jgi:hypothetical protein
MISLAMLLLIALGINQVFKITSDTIGTGLALGDAVRAQRALRTTLASDFEGTPTSSTDGILRASEQPAILIHAMRAAAFANRAEEQGDRDYDPAAAPGVREDAILTIDLDGRDSDGNGNIEGDLNVPGEIIPYSATNSRNHRVDVLSFFARGEYQRQTGNDGELVSRNMVATGAWIWLGHLAMYKGSGSLDSRVNFPPPGGLNFAQNPRNFYSGDWTLGRMAILLIDPRPSYTGVILDGSQPARRQSFIQRTWQDVFESPDNASPLTDNSEENDDATLRIPSGRARKTMQQARFDLAGADVALMRERIAACEASGSNWFNGMLSRNHTRFFGNSLPTRPLSSADAAGMSPILLTGCTQFIVEYAGDFVTQASDGSVTSAVPDRASGSEVIDFVVTNGVRGIRWYGFPRDVNGDGAIPGTAAGVNGLNVVSSPDVVPLRDLLALAGAPSAPFERNIATSLPTTRTNYVANLRRDDSYMVAWSPDQLTGANARPPSLIRIIVTVADPSGRLQEGITQEYVFKVPTD